MIWMYPRVSKGHSFNGYLLFWVHAMWKGSQKLLIFQNGYATTLFSKLESAI